MIKAARQSKNGTPGIFRFKAQLESGGQNSKNGSSLLVRVPSIIRKQLPSRGTTVEGTINGHPFRATLESDSSGGHSLPVNKAMREGADANVGDTVELVILVPEPEPKVPADFRAALAVSKKATAFWKSLTYMNRHDWIRWIDDAKKSETRAKRIGLAVEWLSSGAKRQPCCFNTYEYVLGHIYKDGNRPKNAYPKSARRVTRAAS